MVKVEAEVYEKELASEMINIEHIANAVQGPVDKEELQFLASFAKEIPERGVIVDIGTCGGRSAFALAVASDASVKVYTIDPKISPSFFEKKKSLKLEERVVELEGRSQDLFENFKDPVDLIFVNGDHSYEVVKKDIEGWCFLVKRNGFCLFHDYHATSYVKKAVDEAEGKMFEKIGIFKLIYAGRKL